MIGRIKQSVVGGLLKGGEHDVDDEDCGLLRC
jgi:hypothetical protein